MALRGSVGGWREPRRIRDSLALSLVLSVNQTHIAALPPPPTHTHSHTHNPSPQVRFAVEQEYALTPVDVLARRTRLAFLDTAAARAALPTVVASRAKVRRARVCVCAVAGGWADGCGCLLGACMCFLVTIALSVVAVAAIRHERGGGVVTGDGEMGARCVL